MLERAMKSKKHQATAYSLLWDRLDREQLGVKFRRMHPLNMMLADFYAPALGLVVMLDGDALDPLRATRDARVRDGGGDVARFSERDVTGDIERVLDELRARIQLHKMHSTH